MKVRNKKVKNPYKRKAFEMRKLEEINKEYAAKCTELGHLINQERFVKKQIEAKLAEIDVLDKEAMAANAKEQKEQSNEQADVASSEQAST